MRCQIRFGSRFSTLVSDAFASAVSMRITVRAPSAAFFERMPERRRESATWARYFSRISFERASSFT